MAQTLVVTFKESPFSPWGRRVTSALSRSLNPLADAAPQCTFQTIGCISAVNSRVGETGLRKKCFLPPLVVEQSRGMDTPRTAQCPKKESAGKGEKTGDAKLIELATFPGFNPGHLIPLPHCVDTLEHMRLVTRAQTRLSVKHDGFRECWKKLFYSQQSQAIFQDTFWWYFLNRYQPNQVIQDKLFSRIAANYVRLLCQEAEERWRDAFFKIYPDVIAQCVYSAFIHAFPASWSSFDDTFKTDLCRIISLWQVGTKPIPNSWDKWDFCALEPPNLLKHVGKDTQPPKSPRKGFNLDALVKEAKIKEVQKSLTKSHRPLPIIRESKLQATIASTAATTPKQQIATASSVRMGGLGGDSRSVSFADLEKVLYSQNHQLLQPQGTVDPRTHGETTPPLENTAIQRGKIEVAKQQFAYLKLKKAQEAKRNGKAGDSSKKTPKAASSTISVKPTAAAQSPKGSQKSATASTLSTTQPKEAPSQGKPHISETAGMSKGPAPQAVKQVSSCDESTAEKESGGSWKEKALAMTKKASVPTVGPKFERVVFDVYGQSPLVKHYLQKRNISSSSGCSLLMQRTEISQLPPSDATTYEDVLRESVKEDKKNQTQFKKHYTRQKQAMAHSQQQRKKATTKHEQDVKNVLAHKKEVQQLGSEIAMHVNKKGGSKKAVSTAISDTLQRVSKA